MDLMIRNMIAADFEALAAWMVTVPLWQRYGLTTARAITQFENAQTRGDLLLTAERGEPVGFAWVMPQAAFGRSAYLRLIGVKPDVMGHGIGAALLNSVESQVAEALFLLVSDFNTEAQRFYQRQGYTQIGAIPDYVVAGITELIYWKRPGAAFAR